MNPPADAREIDQAAQSFLTYLTGGTPVLEHPGFWALLVVVILGLTLIRHGWPWPFCRRRPPE